MTGCFPFILMSAVCPASLPVPQGCHLAQTLHMLLDSIMMLSTAQPSPIHQPAGLSESDCPSLSHLDTGEGQAAASGPGQATAGRLQAVLQLRLKVMFQASAQRPVSEDGTCCGFPSRMDVPTRSQATAMESGRESLRLISTLAASLAASSHSVSSDIGDITAADASTSSSSSPACNASDSVPLAGSAGGPATTPAASSYAE